MPRYLKVAAVKPIRARRSESLVDVENTYVVPTDFPKWKREVLLKVHKWLGVPIKQQQTLLTSLTYEEITIDTELGDGVVRELVQELIVQFLDMGDPLAAVILGVDKYHEFARCGAIEFGNIAFDTELPMSINRRLRLYGIKVLISERIEGVVPLTESMLKKLVHECLRDESDERNPRRYL